MAFQIESSLLQSLETMTTHLRDSIGIITSLTTLLEEDLDALQSRVDEIPLLLSHTDQSLSAASFQCKQINVHVTYICMYYVHNLLVVVYHT